MTYFTLAPQTLIALACTFIFTLILIFIVRAMIQVKSEYNLRTELAQKDNFALGISYAAIIFTLIVITAFLLNTFSFTDVKADILYGIALVCIAFIFIHIGKNIHDNIILSHFNEEKAIKEKNICAAFIDAAVIISNGAIVIALYKWSNTQSLDGLLILSVCFILMQGFMMLHSRWLEYLFAKTNQGDSLQHQFKFENTSLGLRYGGQTLGFSLALCAGICSTSYFPGALVENLISISLQAAALVVLQMLISVSFIKLALPKINVEAEIDHQDNIGIASIEFAVYIATSLILINLFCL